MNNATTILCKWPNRSLLARDLRVSDSALASWARRDSIPGRYWLALVDAAAAAGIDGVTLETLAQLHDYRRAPPKSPG